MRAVLMTEANRPVAVEDVTPLDLGPRDVIVRITASGVCHSDLSFARGFLGKVRPTILGHEAVGIVEACGSAVADLVPGDKVIASGIPACGSCWFCRRNESNLCELTAHVHKPRCRRADGSTAGAVTGLGTFAEAMAVDRASLVKVTTDLPDEQLALIGCGVTTGVGAALNTARVEPGTSVAVIGCGGVGQSVIQGAVIAGAAEIIAVDPVELKRKTAEAFGATSTVDPATGDPVEQVKALTGGRGPDYAFEVVGRPETVEQAYATARRGGTVVVVGMPKADASVVLPAWSLFYDGKRILGSVYGSAQIKRDFDRFIDLVEAGRLDIASMLTRRITLDEVELAFRAMEHGEVIRSVIIL